MKQVSLGLSRHSARHARSSGRWSSRSMRCRSRSATALRSRASATPTTCPTSSSIEQLEQSSRRRCRMRCSILRHRLAQRPKGRIPSPLRKCTSLLSARACKSVRHLAMKAKNGPGRKEFEPRRRCPSKWLSWTHRRLRSTSRSHPKRSIFTNSDSVGRRLPVD
jgi:hypothetical protein